MFCRKCGQRLSDKAKFCENCGERIGVSEQEKEVKLIPTKCDCCGASIKRLSPTHYICEYCGSEYYTSLNGSVIESRVTEKEILDTFYTAAKFEIKGKHWDELQCLLGEADKLSDNAIYCVKLGRAYRRNNMNAKALEWYERAQAINQHYAPIYTNIGAVYLLTNQFEKAEEPCKKAVELMNMNRMEYSVDDYAVAYSNLAIAVGQQGRKDEAKQYLKIAEENGYKNGNTVRKMIGIKKGLFF